MKKIIFLLLCVVSLPQVLMAQVDDDLYFIPSKKKVVKKEAPVKQEPAQRMVVVKSQSPKMVVTSPGTQVVVRNSKKRVRDVDEYNRRYDAKDYSFSQEGETIYIDEREDDGLDGEWVNGFEGSQDDYEYATRIIRFRNPRFAVSISSPYYWDVVYGLNSWEWNIYTDGFYAYAFPTFSNRLWWDWRYGSYGWGWGYPSAYYSWGGWYGPSWSFSWGGWWGHPHYYHPHYCHPHHHYYPSWGGGYYRGYDSYTRRGVAGYRSGYRDSGSMVRRGVSNTRSEAGQVRGNNRSSYVRNHSRVVGTRQNATRSSSVRTSASETRRSTYTRPSSTRSNASYQNGSGIRRNQGSVGVGERRSSTRSQSTYNRGSSRSQSSSYQQRNQSRSNDEYRSRTYSPSRSSSSSSYGSPSRSSSSRSSYSSGGGSSRSSGGGSSSRSRR